MCRDMTEADLRTMEQGLLRRVVLASIVEGRRRTDPNLWCLKGLSLPGEADVAHLCDGLHPDKAGYIAMADWFVITRDPASALGQALAATSGRVLTAVRR